MTDVLEHFIDNTFEAGRGQRTQPIYNPSTGKVLREVRLAEAEDVDWAVAAAAAAFEAWSETSLMRRTAILFRFRELLNADLDRLAGVITVEHGKVLSDARGELQRGLEIVEMACGLADHLQGRFSDQVSTGIDVHSFRQPLGVVAGITPFNFPAMVPLWMAPLAIATGNTFVLKPSERDPSVSNEIGQLWARAGLPPGVFNVVHGDKVSVDRLLTHPDVRAISFVGSTPIAKYIHDVAASNGKRVQALGGAKNHAVILPDADIDYAADHLAAAAYGSAGERCMAISVAVAVGDAADDLVKAVQRKAEAVKVGDGTDPSSEMGPVITAASKARICQAVEAAANAGAAVVVDGRDYTVEGHEEGFFVGPTLLDNVPLDAAAYKEELFGPVLVVVRVPDLDAAIDLINSSPYGNGTAIFTGSGHAAREFERRVTVGMIGVNVPVPVPVASYSFGGWKSSLFGGAHIYGPEGVAFYTQAKVVTTRWPHAASADSGASFAFPSSS